MKRLFYVLSTFLLLGVVYVSAPVKIGAVTQEVTPTWVLTNVFSDYYWFETEISKPVGSKYLTMTLPQSDLSVIENGGLESELLLYDFSDTLIETINLAETFGDNLNDTMIIDFVSLDYWEGFDWEDVYTLEFRIVQSFSSPPSGITAYWNGAENNSFIFDYEYYTDYYFIRQVGAIEYAKTSIITSDNVYNITLDLRDMFNYNYELTRGGYIQVRTLGGTLLETINFDDLNLTSPTLFSIDLSLDGYTPEQASRFDIYLQKEEDLTASRLISYNESFKFSFNSNNDIVKVNFVSRGDVVNTVTTLLGSTVSIYEPDEIEGFKFIGWTDKDFNWLQSHTSLNESMLIDDEIYFYANYEKINTINIPDAVDPTPPEGEDVNTLLAVFGFDSLVGYIILYFVIVVVVIFGLLWLEVPLIVTSIILLMITILFSYIGLLPLFVSILAYGLVSLMFVFGIREGANYG